jgi:hypothetical protein
VHEIEVGITSNLEAQRELDHVIRQAGELSRTAGGRQGITLIHLSAQPEPLSVIEATASVHFSAQPETILRKKLPNTANEECSRQAGQLRLVVQKNAYVELKSGPL